MLTCFFPLLVTSTTRPSGLQSSLSTRFILSGACADGMLRVVVLMSAAEDGTQAGVGGAQYPQNGKHWEAGLLGCSATFMLPKHVKNMSKTCQKHVKNTASVLIFFYLGAKDIISRSKASLAKQVCGLIRCNSDVCICSKHVSYRHLYT